MKESQEGKILGKKKSQEPKASQRAPELGQGWQTGTLENAPLPLLPPPPHIATGAPTAGNCGQVRTAVKSGPGWPESLPAAPLSYSCPLTWPTENWEHWTKTMGTMSHHRPIQGALRNLWLQ